MSGAAAWSAIPDWPSSCWAIVVLRIRFLAAVSFCCSILPAPLGAQLITNPKAIPRTGHPPVVFVNGFETNCGGVSFQGDFGIADQVLQSIGRASLFFNNCTVSGSASIEKLGAAFGSFLAGLNLR